MIGKRNRHVTFWRPSGNLNAANEPIPNDWILVKGKWAEFKSQTGMATIRAAASGNDINTPLDRYSVRVNFDTELNVSMQMRDSLGNRYNVVAVLHDYATRNNTDVVVELGGSNG